MQFYKLLTLSNQAEVCKKIRKTCYILQKANGRSLASYWDLQFSRIKLFLLNCIMELNRIYYLIPFNFNSTHYCNCSPYFMVKYRWYFWNFNIGQLRFFFLMMMYLSHNSAKISHVRPNFEEDGDTKVFAINLHFHVVCSKNNFYVFSLILFDWPVLLRYSGFV